MFNTLFATIGKAIGIGSVSVTPFMYMLIRSTIIYFLGVVIARFNKKLLGVRTPFNFILFIMLGSIFASAILSEQLFLPIVGTILFLILLNVAMAMISFMFPALEYFIKGKPLMLVKDGKIQWHAMKKHFITEHEVINELQTQLHTHDLSQVESAILANDGSINFILKK